MDIGAHCAVPACHQQDFLPFTCDCCCGIFCLDHRSYDAHECPQAGSHDRRVVQCPVCKQLIRWTAALDVNAVWDQHVRSGECTREQCKHHPLEQPTKRKKKRCAAAGCRDVLLTSNEFHCRKCTQDVCLKHRFEADHACDRRRTDQRQQWLGGLQATSVKGKQPPSQLTKTAQETAASFVSGTKAGVASLVQNDQSGSNPITVNSEECPLCHQKFNYVSQLIAHVNRAHPDTSDPRRATPATSETTAPTRDPSGNETCPQCRAVFPTLSALIQHAESVHTSARATTTGRASEQDKCNLM
ncbi:hypothetical protein PsorP6_015961 [Peronosclerospora sorghi]|uniref:Uncharacterized protein n=1 Tax=Peronosclerospora sorghi TaxID=230839 RepID=A0ACC0WLZ9_9STRA|nr:hypothetical protein PsorP6_015961 [Peronosclerospora sorghi]